MSGLNLILAEKYVRVVKENDREHFRVDFTSFETAYQSLITIKDPDTFLNALGEIYEHHNRLYRIKPSGSSVGPYIKQFEQYVQIKDPEIFKAINSGFWYLHKVQHNYSRSTLEWAKAEYIVRFNMWREYRESIENLQKGSEEAGFDLDV